MRDLVLFDPRKELLSQLGFSGTYDSPVIVKTKKIPKTKSFKIATAEQRYLVEHSLVDAFVLDKVDLIAIRFAAENNIRIIFPFSNLFGKNKANSLRTMKKNAELARKNKTPALLCSFANSEEELVGSSDLIAFGEILGFDKKQAREAMQ